MGSKLNRLNLKQSFASAMVCLLVLAFAPAVQAKSKKTSKKVVAPRASASTPAKSKPAKKKIIAKINFSNEKTRKPAQANQVPKNVPTKLPEKKVVEVAFEAAPSEAEIEPLAKSAYTARQAAQPELVKITAIQTPAQQPVSAPQTVAMKAKSQQETWNDFQKSAENDMDDY